MTRSRTPSLEKAIDAVTLVASNPPRPARQNAANQNVLIISTPKLNRERDQSTLILCCAQPELNFRGSGWGVLVNSCVPTLSAINHASSSTASDAQPAHMVQPLAVA